MNSLVIVTCLAVGVLACLVLGREEVHHIHSENGRNVHVHLHEVGNCEEKVDHHHDHGDNKPAAADVMAKPTKPGKKKKGGKKGKKSKMMHDAPTEETVNGVHPEHHEGDDDIHIHIHEAGENCANHDDHHGEHGEHHGRHHGHHGEHHGDHHGHHGEHHGEHHGHRGGHGGRGGHACAMCARALQHHGPDHDDHRQDHPGHHGPHSHEEDAAKHDHSEDYVYAHCAMGPNTGVALKKRSTITGSVHLRQLIYGGPVEMQIDLEGFQAQDGVMQHEHGLHVHEFGDLTDGCQSTGSHFNPFGVDHGAPTDDIRHAGDYGNIRCDDKGKTNVAMNDSRSTLIGYHNIIGRALVIHEKADDLGKGGTPASLKTGDAGGRIACCTIVRAKPHGHWESHVHDHSGDHHHDPHDDHGDHKDHNHEDHMHGHGKHMHRGKKDKATSEAKADHGDPSQHLDPAREG